MATRRSLPWPEDSRNALVRHMHDGLLHRPAGGVEAKVAAVE